PIVGGLVSILSFYLPFYVLSLTSIVAFAIVSLRLKETPKPEKASLQLQITKLSGYLRDKRFQKTVVLIVLFYALINIYYSFFTVFLNDEGISIPLIGVILTVALLPAVTLEVPMGHLMDSRGIRKTLSLAVVLTTFTALMIPLSSNFYYTIVFVTAF
ncbi:MAG: MFS transporter, partial [Thaumarchaeota archaeon]|nr:MFS transporter [Nitrososphaerota archaeon]